MNFKIVTNNNYKNLLDIYNEFAENSKEIFIASAFFSNDKIIKKWLDEGKKINLLISLRPPTNYYALKNIYNDGKIEIRFLGKEFHSKLSIFKKNEIVGAVIGSSNFTDNGLVNNIETNFSSADKEFSSKMLNRFEVIWENAFKLEPYDLAEYQKIFNSFNNKNKDNNKEYEEFAEEIINNRNKIGNKKIAITEEAKQYLIYWKYVNEIKENIEDISIEKYPNIPIYLTIDHFWHWIKIVWGKNNNRLSNPDTKKIRKMFSEYCEWDLTGGNYTTKMYDISKNIFNKYLSIENIHNLNKEDAMEVYRNLHSGFARTNRFSSDKSFLKRNGIKKIRNSLFYLLYSKDDIELKISKMQKDEDYRLDELGLSGIQEIIGWVYNEKYPIRNSKSDDAISLIGYKI